jgi:hypothetical protein
MGAGKRATVGMMLINLEIARERQEQVRRDMQASHGGRYGRAARAAGGPSGAFGRLRPALSAAMQLAVAIVAVGLRARR